MSRTLSLLAQLGSYAPADEVEAGHARAMVNLLTTSPHAFSRGQFAPGHVTASCYVIDADGRLLLHHHRRLGRWLQMGGHVEAEENVDGAAAREAREESGLRDLELVGGIFDLDVHFIPAGKGEPDHHHYDVRYLARTASPSTIAIQPGESTELAWLPLGEARALMNAPESDRVVRKIELLLAARSHP